MSLFVLVKLIFLFFTTCSHAFADMLHAAYDVERNQDIYFKEVADGISSITVGEIEGEKAPLCMVGGNCSVQGFDFQVSFSRHADCITRIEEKGFHCFVKHL